MQAIDDLEKRIQAAANILKTPGGKSLVALLELEFDGTVFSPDNPHQTAFNLGAREVVQFLRQLQEHNDK